MRTLRSPNGCVWDIEQTHKSLRRYIIEEVYEVIEAIELEDKNLLCEELGDLLLQIVFHARMAEEAGDFSMQDVIDGITEKMIRRHPHVFGDISVKDSGEVLLNWEAIKREEKKAERKSLLDGVPNGLPALLRADKLQGKAAKAGFDWDDIAPVWDKLDEEIAELKEAAATGDKSAIEGELGDVLFSVVNLARFLKIDGELALNLTNRKFKERFSYVEKKVQESGRPWQSYTLDELDNYWNEAKRRQI
jgi:tetrapyrrole methylase family protein/MazG family protein